MQRGGHLLADRPRRELETAHQHHRLETREGIAGRVRVDRGDATVVARVERLQHVEGLGTSHLADDDAVGPHPQRVDHEVTGRDLALVLDVGLASLETDHVVLIEDQLGGVLDGHDPLGVGDRLTHRAEQGGLARAGTARHEQVLAHAHHVVEEAHHVLGPHAQPQEVLAPQALTTEAADRERRPIERDRRDRRVHAAAVGESQVHHRAGHVDPPADASGDALDDAADVILVLEAHVRALERAEALDVDPVGGVDQDVGHRGIGHQRRERPHAEGLLEQLVAQTRALLLVQRQVLHAERAVDELAHRELDVLLARTEQVLLADVVEQALVEPRLDRQVVRRAADRLGLAHTTVVVGASHLRPQPRRGRGRQRRSEVAPRLLLGACSFVRADALERSQGVPLAVHTMPPLAPTASLCALAPGLAAPSISRTTPARARPNPNRLPQLRA